MNALAHLLYVLAEGLITLGISWIARAFRDRKAHVEAAKDKANSVKEDLYE